MAKHVCPNSFHGEGAKGACFVDIQESEREGYANLEVGWSCVIVHNKDIPISWLSELVEVASSHVDGIAGFLKEHGRGGDDSAGHNSYALWCDPA